MGGLSHTVSGDIASFRTPSRVPIESLKFHFLPKQEGSGDPSPTNIRPITGWTELNGWKFGKNLIKFVAKTAESYGVTWVENEYGIVSYEGTPTSWTSIVLGTVKLNGAKTIYGKIFGDESNVSFNTLYIYDSSGTRIAQIGTPWESSTHGDKYVEVDLSDYPTADYVDIRLKRVSNNVYMKGKCYAVVTDKLEYLKIPIIFPISGKNLVNDETTTLKNWTTKDGHRYISTNTDTRDSVSMYVVQYGPNDVVLKNNVKYTPVVIGRNSLTIDVVKGCNKILLKHNGVVRDFGVFIPWDGRVGTYTISANFESIDLSTVGGFIFSDVQIELGDTMTSYEIYSSDNTFYGGYIDPVAGEIVAEYALATATKSDFGEKMSPSTGGIEYRNTTKNYPPTASGVTWNTARQQQKFNLGAIANPYSEGSYGDYIGVMYSMSNYNMHAMRISEALYQAMGDDDVAMISYKLETPIHIPIPAQDLQAFLDHNNFWSDANDITEVTYPVTESKDILATRKKAIAFDHAHHKKVKWNQIQIDGNFQDISKYEGLTNYTNVSASNGIITATCITKPTQFYHTGFRTKNSVGFLAIPYNHKVLVTAYLRSSEESRVRIYGLVGSNGNTYTYGYNYANANIPSNEWVRLIGFIPNRPETPPPGLDDTIIKRFKPLILGKDGDISTIPNGATLECKLLMAFDLTQMFGLGNEPSTVEEFERICAINGIDLTTYQPYDEGSDRWLIVP